MTKKWKILKNEDLHLFHPVRRVTLVDGSRVAIDLVTGITCGLDEQLQKTEELEEKYKQRMSLRNQINDVYLREEKEWLIILHLVQKEFTNTRN